MRRAIEMGASRVAVTLGGEGAMACDGRRCWRVTIPRIDVVNTIGSGDAFAAGLAKGLLDGRDFVEACRLAAACGAANALTIMSGEVHVEDVERILPEVGVEEIKS
jgi:fructose-1-phosphate kinase PfkB-like protein